MIMVTGKFQELLVMTINSTLQFFTYGFYDVLRKTRKSNSYF